MSKMSFNAFQSLPNGQTFQPLAEAARKLPIGVLQRLDPVVASSIAAEHPVRDEGVKVGAEEVRPQGVLGANDRVPPVAEGALGAADPGQGRPDKVPGGGHVEGHPQVGHLGGDEAGQDRLDDDARLMGSLEGQRVREVVEVGFGGGVQRQQRNRVQG